MTTVAAVAVPRRSLALDVRAVKIVVQRDLIRTYQDRTRFVSALVQPVLFLFVLGSGL
jgi:ABC-2 type transport system permease protein